MSSNNVTNELNETQNNEITQLRNENAVLKDTVAELQMQLNWLKKQVFGKKSEKSCSLMNDADQLSMFSDGPAENTVVSNKEKTVTVPEHTRKARRTHDEWMNSLEVKEELHKLNPEDLVCDKCGSEMKIIGTDKVRDELVYVPARYFIRRHMAEVAKCTKCGYDESQDSECEETMSNWVIHMSKNWGEPVMKAMKKEPLKSNVIHAGESPLTVLREKGRKATTESKMWVYCNGRIRDKSIVIFDYTETRKSEHPVNFLKGYAGYLRGYNAVPDVTRCACLTHIRRKFLKTLPSDPEQRKTSVSAKVVKYIADIYAIEEKLKDESPEIRYETRLAETKPLLDALFAYLESINTMKNSLGDAVRYALNEKKYMYSFLKCPDVPVDNNRAENCIRPYTVGRKNWLHCNTPAGANASAVWYSVISTACANRLNVEQYLSDLFSKPAGTIILPWNEK